MAIFNGKNLSGSIGKIKFSNTKDGQRASAMPESVFQTIGSQKTANLFGKASVLGGQIRFGMAEIIAGCYDGKLVNRLTLELQSILTHFYNSASEEFRFSSRSFNKLTGFEFNAASAWRSHLWLTPEVSLDGLILTVRLPALDFSSDLAFPPAANNCVLKILVNQYALEAGYRRYDLEAELEINLSDGFVPEQKWEFEVAEGCLCLVGIGLEYFKLDRNMKTVLQNKTFNPSGICGAVMTSGVFEFPENEDEYSSETLWLPLDVTL